MALLATNTELSGDAVTVSSKVEDNVDVLAGTGTLGLVGVNINATRLDETIKNKLSITGGSITGKDISLLSTVTGTSYAHAALGTATAVGTAVAYADVYADGKNSLAIDGTAITADESILVRALHDSTYRTQVNGGSLIVAGGGYVEAESEDKLANTVTIKNASLINKGDNTTAVNTTDSQVTKAVAGATEIAAMKSSTAKTKTIYGSVTGVGGLANSSTAMVDDGQLSGITLSKNTIQNTGSNGVVDIYALYNSVADVDMTFGSGNVLAGGGGVYAIFCHFPAEQPPSVALTGKCKCFHLGKR